MEGSKYIFRRKIYDKLLKWKALNGTEALLIEGARRIGKSTIVEEFAKNEYESYILIDFTKSSPEVFRLFDDMSNLDSFFTYLQLLFGVSLVKRKSLIIFDEVQFAPRARQSIKHLVGDGRYDYIETGSLISIKKNVENILIPSEEHKIKMYPMDYEEFRWALGDNATGDLLRSAYRQRQKLGPELNRKLMTDLRLYMLVGGMPQAVATYLSTNDLAAVDDIKRRIIDLYDSDFMRIDASGRLSKMFKEIPAQLSRNISRYQMTPVVGKLAKTTEDSLLSEITQSMTINMCCHVSDPASNMAAYINTSYFKMFVGDTGLFVTLAFMNADFTENIIYRKLLFDKLDANLGYIYENLVAQMLVAEGYELRYYTFPNDNNTNSYEIDFIIPDGSKLIPIEVKSSGYKTHASLDAFCKKFSSRYSRAILVTTKEPSHDGNIDIVPFYMIPFIR